ncbi:uncharacterized protein LOC128243175 isoform X2 [Mya arenaria]|uniref:uncharacterized protein LOC128243175 isoform X2 n=1 Tax=Mya arenaria TaxID=6604 RepID=UPI0022E6A69D|nr:uncharacterized protein LOC128243175 isoform X2 [Mya arenaria]
MAHKSEVGIYNSSQEFVCLKDVLHSFNNSINEEQAWAVCYQCAQYFSQNPSQECFRDIYYYGIAAIRISKDGDLKVKVDFSQGSGKGPPSPDKRSSFSMSKEFKSVISETDATQALGTAIYKALDYGLSEHEEPHLSPDLEALIDLLIAQPADDDEGIDIERDCDHDTDQDSQGREQSIFQDVIQMCVRRLSSQQNAQMHYRAVCRALATESSELSTFLDNIARGHERLASTGDDQPSVDDLERNDWARLWVQIMRQLRHGVRLKKVEQVHLPPVEFELTPFEILLEDIRLGRFKLNRITVNGDIPPKLKNDAHAVILDFIRSRPPLKPATRRQLKEKPVREMDTREKLMEEICKMDIKLRPVKKGKVVVRKPTWLGDDDDSSDESSPPPARIVIKPVAAFQVSTDDSDSYISETDEDGRRHISGPNMSPLTPPDNRAMRAAVAKDLIQHSPSQQSLHRRHTIGSCDTKNGQKVSAPSQHASVAEEDEEEETVTSSGFNRDSACRRPSRSKLVSYRQKHSGDRLQSSEDCQPHVSAHSCTKSRHKSHLMHAGHSVLSKSHGNLIDGSVTVHDDMHGMLYSEPSRISRSVSVAAISDPHRSYSPAGHPPRSQSPHMSSGRSESPARRLSLSRSQTFTCSIPRKSRSCLRNETHIATRCDSPQTRSLKRNDSFPPPRSESETNLRAESPRRHSIQVAQTHSVDSTKDTNIPSERSRRYSTQNVVKARQSCASSESVCTQSVHVRDSSSEVSSQNRHQHRHRRPQSHAGVVIDRPHSHADVVNDRPHSHADVNKDRLHSHAGIVSDRPFEHAVVVSDPKPSVVHNSRALPRELHARVKHMQRHASVAGDASTARAKHVRRDPKHSKLAWSETVDNDSNSDHEEKFRSELHIGATKNIEKTKNDSSKMSTAVSVNKSESKDESRSVKESRPVIESKSVTESRKPAVSKLQESQSAKEISSEEKVESSEENSVPKSRIGIIRARSRPEISNTKSRRLLIKQEEEKFFRKIESVRKGEKTDSALSRTESHRERPASELGMARRSERERPATELDFNRQSRMREHIIRARSGQRAPIISRHSTGELQTMKDGVKAASERQSGVVDRVEGDKDMAKKTVRLSRQSAIRTERSDIRLKIPTKPVSDESDSEAKPKETRLRRVGVVAKTDSMSDENNSNSEPQHSQVKETLPKQTVPKNDVEESQKDNAAKERVRSAARHEFKQVRRVIRSSSEVRLRPEVKPLKGSHNLPVDLENHHLNEIPNQLVIIPPPEFRDPVDAHHSGSNNTINGVETTDGVQHEPCEIPEVIKTSKAEFKVADLLHHKWQNPIECLSLTLEEVTHIRTVLTRAELESLIPDHDLYTQVAKGKLCFTCKKTKFTIFGQWGTKCKFCGRTICNYCLRKMNVPTEHFEKIPVYTLSPVPLSPEVLEALKVYESTGSVPHSPVQTRKTSAVERPPSRGPEDDVTTPGAEGEDRPARRRSLQRSHTIGVGSRPPPNRALLKGPQMSICCDCKSMIMEIIRASRSSVSLLTGKSGSQESSPDTPSRSQTPSSELQGGVSRPRRLELEERPRPRSMLATLNFKSFNLSSKFGSEA